jgi:lipopolysaccharide/colanic/teichoic acid biosynthesis glycosyltransferase
MVRLDLHYLEHWSVGMEIRIVLRTVYAVLRHKGAY